MTERLSLDSRLSLLPTLRGFVDRLCRRLIEPPLEDGALARIQLAVGEVMTNIVRHAYHGRSDGRIEIEAEVCGDRVLFRLYDWGEPFTLPPIVEPDLFEVRDGGLGLYLISRSADRVSYDRESDGRNCVTLEAFRPGRGERT